MMPQHTPPTGGITPRHPCRLPTATAWRVQALLRERSPMGFAWGVRDCAMLAFDVVQAATGRDVAADLRGAYHTASQALALLGPMGGLAAMAAQRFGVPVQWADGADGDLVLFSQRDCAAGRIFGGALGVRWRGVCIGQGGLGLVQAPAAAALACWQMA